VVKHHPRKYQRLGERYARFFGIIFLILLGLSLFVFVIYKRSNQTLPFVSIVIANNPTIILFATDKDNVTTITLSGDIEIQGVSGYGNYALNSLWRLGRMDKKNGLVFVRSLSEDIGLPIGKYVGPNTDELSQLTINEAVRKYLSVSSLWGLLTGKYSHNLSLDDMIRLVRFMNSVDLNKSNAITLDSTNGITSKQNADSSTSPIFDQIKFDAKYPTLFELPQIRKEAYRIAVVNPFEIPGLAQHYARYLNHLGLYVISTSSSQFNKDDNICRIKFNASASGSVTIQSLQTIFGCISEISTEKGISDIELQIGKNYANYFQAEVD
jgi:hypothetical protein